MSELLEVVKSYSSPINTLLLCGILMALRSLQKDLKDIRDNHLPHIYDRLGHIEGVKAGVELERMKR